MMEITSISGNSSAPRRSPYVVVLVVWVLIQVLAPIPRDHLSHCGDDIVSFRVGHARIQRQGDRSIGVILGSRKHPAAESERLCVVRMQVNGAEMDADAHVFGLNGV